MFMITRKKFFLLASRAATIDGVSNFIGEGK